MSIQRSIFRSVVTATLAVFLLGFSLYAKAQDVLLVHAINNSWAAEVKAKLVATGSFTSVDIFDGKSGTPTLVQLQAYDSILVWTDSRFANSSAVGDVIADYVDGGGGVAQATFSFWTHGIWLGGRWRSQNYDVWQPGGQSQGTVLTLGAIHQPGHPILAGVASFNGGASSYHNTVGALNPGAAAIADWSNGRPLIAENITSFNGCVVGLNFYPPSSDSRSDFWNVNTDGDLLLANALLYCGEVDTDGDGVLDKDDFCPADTELAESVPTSGALNPNHWALTDGDGDFDTVIKGKGKGPNRSYTIEDTAGCSCEQIIEIQGLGDGHSKHGCSISAMDDWLDFVNP